MKASKNIPIIFLILFVGFQLQVHAQGAGSVSSFTIVVAEDVLDNDGVDPRGYDFDEDFDNYKDEIDSTASDASVSMQISHGSNGDNLQADIETLLGSSDSASILERLSNQLAQASTGDNDDGFYRIVLEYN